MPPTIIVGDDENAGDVAAKLLRIATNQRHVKVRSDLRRPAFDVPEYVYSEYVGDTDERGEDEQRANALAAQAAAEEAETSLTGDETPDGAANADPGAGLDDELAKMTGDKTPDSAVNADPFARPDPDPEPETDGDQGDGDTEAKPKPRKRAPRKTAAPRKAAKSTSPAAGAAE